ncbi:MAG: SdiA-regulated domain-containing protein [Chitinophagales bacterium]
MKQEAGPVMGQKYFAIFSAGVEFLYSRLLCLLVFYFFMQGQAGCQPVNYASPPGYDLTKPKTFFMNEALHEISGIVFFGKNYDSLYAIEDEDGKLFYFHLGDGKFPHARFGKKGDYEDVTVLDGKKFIVLRSDGSLYVFPVSQARDKDIADVQIYKHFMPTGEYEGIYADDDGKVYVLCKNCPDDNQKKKVSVYIIQDSANGQLGITGQFRVDVSAIELSSINIMKKPKFHPSCLAKNPITKEWYIISSVNKLLISLNSQWKLTASYPLNPSLFKQPEGLAFDNKGNMYISNEGASGTANILVFNYKKP